MKRLLLLALLITVAPCFAAEPVLRPNDYLAICGDSITEQKLYSAFIEDYLLMCQPVSNVQSIQFGWGGERADGFLKRMENDCLRFKPTVATTCYGMNDGQYTKLTDQIATTYKSNMEKVCETFKMNNVRVVVGSPGCVDSFTFKRPSVAADEYNKTLAAERDIAKEIAAEKKLAFADVYQAMYDAMEKAKAKYGKEYPVCGGDGIHPGANGHVLMAYAFLKGMGVSGDIGTIKVDLAAKKADASDGHVVKSFSDAGELTIESKKYPFCFLPDDKSPTDDSSPNSMRGIIQFCPFNEDLNRLTLIVNGVKGSAKITWGDASKEFTGEQLAKGINLAAEFLDNPFVENFRKVHQAVAEQQAFETPMIKTLVNGRLRYGSLPGGAETGIEKLISDATDIDTGLRNAAAKAVTPVTHTIKIEVVK
jgi:lysophospholipase L1-like esterase